MKNSKAASLLFSLLFLLMLSAGCSSEDSGNNTNGGTDSKNTDNTSQINRITDNKSIYSRDNDSLEDVYVTIVTDNKVTMADVNAWQLESGQPKPEINVRFDYGRPASDMTGVNANAVLYQRGQLATTSNLKSYKIKLSDAAPEWNDQDELNLNKHPYDLTKIRNKLCFDLIKLFPDSFSCRTQFCRLYIRDLNSSNKEYVDYGLFTHVEDIDRSYLKDRGIEKKAYLYKAQNFEFLTYPDIIKDVSDPGYSKEEFETLLEIKGEEDHTRLIQMLKDVNDENRDINEVIGKHFDRDNYLTWMAMNILLGNTDTNVANFYLLSPVSQDKWYFVPWDYDFSLGYDYQTGSDNSIWSPDYIRDGASMYWGVPLHTRFLKDPQNVKDLTAKIEELSLIASKEVIADMARRMYASTNEIVKRMPDLALMGTSKENYEAEMLRLSSTVEDNKKAYYEGLKKPMPFDLYDVQTAGNGYNFTWEPAYDLDGDALTYDFHISESPDFSDTVREITGIQGTSVTIASLPSGTYYWKAEAVDPSGNRREAFDVYFDEEEEFEYFGVRQFTVD